MPIRVVIADDDPLQRLDLKEQLTALGYLVVGEAANGWSVIALTREQRPDLVIMDIRMPIMDGLSASAILARQHVAPVILLSAFHDSDFVAQASTAGVLAYLIKPLHARQLALTIPLALTRYQQLQALVKEHDDLAHRLEQYRRAERDRGLLLEKRRLDGLS